MKVWEVQTYSTSRFWGRTFHTHGVFTDYVKAYVFYRECLDRSGGQAEILEHELDTSAASGAETTRFESLKAKDIQFT